MILKLILKIWGVRVGTVCGGLFQRGGEYFDYLTDVLIIRSASRCLLTPSCFKIVFSCSNMPNIPHGQGIESFFLCCSFPAFEF
jgi:hypothetical protein